MAPWPMPEKWRHYGATGKYRNVRGMFPGRTYFAFFVETERGRCAHGSAENIYGAMTAGLVTPEAPGLVTPIIAKARG